MYYKYELWSARYSTDDEGECEYYPEMCIDTILIPCSQDDAKTAYGVLVEHNFTVPEDNKFRICASGVNWLLEMYVEIHDVWVPHSVLYFRGVVDNQTEE